MAIVSRYSAAERHWRLVHPLEQRGGRNRAEASDDLTLWTVLAATSSSRNSSTGDVTATIALGSVTGAYTVDAAFGPNTWSFTNGFTVN